MFFGEHSECAVISEKGECRNPEFARPSMSGFGINVSELMKPFGWKSDSVTHDFEPVKDKMGNVCSLVLIN